MQYMLQGLRIPGREGVHDIPLSVRDAGSPQFLDFGGHIAFPGFTDVHVHLREPGFSYKETILDGTRAAAAQGYQSLCTMPNLSPVPDCAEHLRQQINIIQRDALVPVFPFGSITKEEKGQALSDMEGLAPLVVGFSDDGRGVKDTGLMREAMQRAKALDKVIAAHCEDTAYAPEDPRSEWAEAERNIRLAAETGAKLHICHVSSRVTLDMVRQAKKSGIDVSMETAPHYLTLSVQDVTDDGRFKMNPPLRDRKDREALLAALSDGTVDMIATDHAPHSPEEKSRGFAHSLNGIVGLETAFPVLYTALVKTSIITLEKLVSLMGANARGRFGIKEAPMEGENASIAVFDLETPYRLDSSRFLSKGRSTPFDGMEVYGRCLLNAVNGRIVLDGRKA